MGGCAQDPGRPHPWCSTSGNWRCWLKFFQEAGNGVPGPEHSICKGPEVRETETEYSTNIVHSQDRKSEEEAVLVPGY